MNMRLTGWMAVTGLILSGVLLAAQESLDEHSVILTGSFCEHIFDQRSRPAPKVPDGSVWDPTVEQVNALWKALPAYLDAPPKRLHRPLEHFYRQYVGFVRGGRPFIYLNAFNMNRPRWREQPVLVEDGSWDYFGVEYDVETGELLNYYTNGF